MSVLLPRPPSRLARALHRGGLAQTPVARSFRGASRGTWWLAPLTALVVIVVVELHVGRHATAAAPASAAPVPAPVIAAKVLPEYTVPGGVEARTDTVDRTLFNPTRRPAPPPAPPPEAARQMQRGQFALTGTTVVDGKSTAFLKELKSGRPRRVREGDSLEGMLVAEVKSDRVKLTLGGESEDVMLKVVPNSKQTPQPAGVPVPLPVAAQGVPVPGAPPVAQAPAAGMPGPPDAQNLLERRRAARAAQAAAAAQAAQAAQPGAAPPGVVPAPQAGQPDQGWSAVYRRMQQQQHGAGTPAPQ